MNAFRWLFTVAAVTVFCPTARAVGEDAALSFFESKVRPLLVDKCYGCHSVESGKSKGGLLLDSRESLRRGGESGATLDGVDPDKSLLLRAVRREEKDLAMPPKEPLSAAEVRVFEEWVRMGAPDPRVERVAPSPMDKRMEDAKAHWAFQPLRNPEPPEVAGKGWVRTAVDRHVLAALESRGLNPSPPADPRALMRRVYLDVTGLSPAWAEVEKFAAEPTDAAYERIVDGLLSSPHFGERWGRHWLDLARYADSSGLHNDLDRPHAWRYRDYVIASFNADKPYPVFVAEQLAGDEYARGSEEALVATGFCRNGPSNEDNMGNTEQYRLDELDDVISTTASVFMGLSLGCARCHDHKYDPLTSEDYYSLLAVFNGTEKLGLPVRTKSKKDPSEEAVAVHALVEKSAKVRPTYLLRRGNLLNRGPEVQPAPPKVLAATVSSWKTPLEGAASSGRREALAHWIAAPENGLTWRVWANRLWQYAVGKPLAATPSNFGFRGEAPSNPALLEHLACELVRHGGRMKPVLRQIFLSSAYRQSSEHGEASAGVDPDNTLLWRMNRRRMQAEILRDNILHVSGCLNPAMGGTGTKPRIRAELVTASQRNKWPGLVVEGPEQWRRSVYIYAKRQLLLPMLELFDAPTTMESCAIRTESVVPTQALILLNDEFVEEQAGFLAKRVMRESESGGDGHGERQPAAAADPVERMMHAVLLRGVDARRLSQARQFVEERFAVYEAEGKGRAAARQRALADLAHVLLNTSEFLYVD